ncbi:MAG TPA: NAD(P)/FAD-dependent oxidoreductase [Allosphingosinicella sp.]|nr:NAD(P)/FAD-dependent oxidoreductase [Allosphingosinicella sp.]
MATELDIVIVGAGGAGIAAGRRLAEAGPAVSFQIVEAADRVGGRAWTVTRDGMPLDLGCGWLHSADRNPWAKLAEEEGIAIDRSRPAWGRQFANLGFSPEEQAEAAEAYDEFDRRLREEPPPSDRALDALDPGERWNEYLEARSGYLNGVGLAQLSVADYLAYDEAATDENWRLRDGYGTLIAGAAEGLPIALDAPVSRIDRTSTILQIDTARGRLTARAAIVTVPPVVLAEERLRFDPPLDGKAEAASCLPLGLADKLFLTLDHAEELDSDAHMLGNPRRAETGSYYLRPFGRPLIECFFGGAGAAVLEGAGEGAMADFAVGELISAFGSGFRKRLHPLAGSAWGASPWVRGSYSHAMPGHAGARRALAEPVEGRIFFAGEACSAHDFSTAHGAWETGVDAAEQALAALRPTESAVRR